MSKTADVRVLTGNNTRYDEIDGVEITPAFTLRRRSSILDCVAPICARKPDWLILQYNPFSYGKWGLNPYVPKLVSRVKRQSPTTRVAVMVHEMFLVFAFERWQTTIMTTWQRLQFWQLGRQADIMFFSSMSYIDLVSSWFPSTPLRHLPVGCNIDAVDLTAAEARRQLGIADDEFVLGFFGGTRIFRNVEQVIAAATALAATGVKTVLLMIGDGSAEPVKPVPGLRVVAAAKLPASEVSLRFRAMHVYLAPYADGASTRRGTFVAGLAHGLPIVSTIGTNSDKLISDQNGRSCLLVDATDAVAFTNAVLRLAAQPDQRAQLAKSCESFFSNQFTWQKICDAMFEALKSVSGHPTSAQRTRTSV